jgi:hypothetical protein
MKPQIVRDGWDATTDKHDDRDWSSFVDIIDECSRAPIQVPSADDIGLEFSEDLPVNLDIVPIDKDPFEC